MNRRYLYTQDNAKYCGDDNKKKCSAPDEERAARSLFHKTYNHQFKYEHCWLVLRSCSKWQQYSAESKVGIEVGLDKRGPFVDTMSDWNVGGSHGDDMEREVTETGLPDHNFQPTFPETPITDESPFQASNGNERNDEDQRPIGTKAAKEAKQRKKSRKGEASSQVSESINAGFHEMIETSRSNWELLVKNREDTRREKIEFDRQRHEDDKKAYEEERQLTMKAKKSKIMRNMAGITKDLISARRELRHVQSETEYRQLNALVAALEVELEAEMEDMKKDKNVEVVRPPIHTVEHGTQPLNSDWSQRW
ncbi:uncharacterized protein LOC119987824 [Tripterygium wilfordii]|uniref:uncharacterized protein LOC119987824 n=1 Tax=Tripterygium wilfordii TaxID=458696 RepID=UPI0018F7E719|nr:uncharacterized protein LOC119987824 [Tripterygium wilfordii]